MEAGRRATDTQSAVEQTAVVRLVGATKSAAVVEMAKP